jgi:hypothetical protein
LIPSPFLYGGGEYRRDKIIISMCLFRQYKKGAKPEHNVGDVVEYSLDGMFIPTFVGKIVSITEEEEDYQYTLENGIIVNEDNIVE